MRASHFRPGRDRSEECSGNQTSNPVNTLMLFDGHRPRLNKRMLVMFVFPMSFVTVPIALMVVVPIFIIPIMVPSILVSLDR
jgi:hypothetical protein